MNIAQQKPLNHPRGDLRAFCGCGGEPTASVFAKFLEIKVKNGPISSQKGYTAEIKELLIAILDRWRQTDAFSQLNPQITTKISAILPQEGGISK
ncbi:hypothetical protein EHV15_15350 [Paenibacillus oralis]|uniref:Uncharacterized protein n=1 Tax=Paenibacillus oralis TaxID=2490856 RepID=A0A3P3U3M1_9BACL|nr:hypothetical protein [Paenibacillus oralis]RRJ64148.1 hypothetical protein EHV15_15350 [Paenibacillus oralis]